MPYKLEEEDHKSKHNTKLWIKVFILPAKNVHYSRETVYFFVYEFIKLLNSLEVIQISNLLKKLPFLQTLGAIFSYLFIFIYTSDHQIGA